MCHASVQVPFFASSDVQAAYTARSAGDFANPTNSLFSYMPGTTTAGGDHVRAQLGQPAIVQQDLVQWPTPRHRQAPAAAAPGSPGYLTASMAIPPLRRSRRSPRERRQCSASRSQTSSRGWRRSPMHPGAGDRGAEPDEYRFTNPKIGGAPRWSAHRPARAREVVRGRRTRQRGREPGRHLDPSRRASLSRPCPILSPHPLSMIPWIPGHRCGAYSSTGDLNDTITVGFDVLQ